MQSVRLKRLSRRLRTWRRVQKVTLALLGQAVPQALVVLKVLVALKVNAGQWAKSALLVQVFVARKATVVM
ncbi:MAG: hypothetical protein A2W35_17975 [Chloroflexi bacterium RBG_16_57_11]|nr:MAG: hypothetical protein A2W35_17975 [Chloroflexi bacterium RBG_16_57_11]